MGPKLDVNSILKSCSVSSVHNRDVKQFSKKHLFDDDLETCWSSDQGTPQWIQLKFKEGVSLCRASIQFQGGFVGNDCQFLIVRDIDSPVVVPFYPEDNNSVQTFDLPGNVFASEIKIVFNSSSDFFGRVVIYRLSFDICDDSCKR